MFGPVGGIPHDREPCLLDDKAHQHPQVNKDKQQNYSSNNNNNNDNDRHHTAAQQYGTQATVVPTPNSTTTTQLARSKRSKRWLPALTSPVRRFCFGFFLHTKRGAPKQKGVVIFSRLSISTHCCSTIYPLMNKSYSCCGKHPILIPSSLIFPGIFCCKRPPCPVLDVRRYVALFLIFDWPHSSKKDRPNA